MRSLKKWSLFGHFGPVFSSACLVIFVVDQPLLVLEPSSLLGPVYFVMDGAFDHL